MPDPGRHVVGCRGSGGAPATRPLGPAGRGERGRRRRHDRPAAADRTSPARAKPSRASRHPAPPGLIYQIHREWSDHDHRRPLQPRRGIPGDDPRRRRPAARRARPHLALLRRRRAELRLHEGRPEAARRARRAAAAATSTSARTTCSPPATARPPSSGAPPTPTPRTRDGKPVYDWTIVDRIFDTYLERGVRPYVQIGFMPQALSTKPEPYQHDWRPGCLRRDLHRLGLPAEGLREVGRARLPVGEALRRDATAGRRCERWYWEVWNEPNIGYWRGTPEEFHKLHDYAIDAVRRALPDGAGRRARHGRPDGGVPAGLPRALPARDELRHRRDGTPLDFVSFHAKGAPTFVDGHVRMGIAAQLATIDEGFGPSRRSRS